jgi:serine protease Do
MFRRDKWTVMFGSALCLASFAATAIAGPQNAQAASTAPAAKAESQKPEDQDGQTAWATPLAQFNVDGGYLGVYVEEVTPERQKELNLSEERGAIIMKVVKDGPADKAGLKENDVVISFNGRPVDSAMEFQRLLRETPSGRHVALEVIRAGSTSRLQAIMGKRTFGELGNWNAPKVLTTPNEDITNSLGNFVSTPYPGLLARPRIGISAEPLTDQLAAFFGVKDGHGVLISEVVEDTPAARAGLKAGDVILTVDNVKVNSITDLRSELARNTGTAVPIKLVRDHHEMTVTVKTEKRNNGASLVPRLDNLYRSLSDADREM